jgi:hypothetical protein
MQEGRIHIEKINGPFLFREHGTLAEYKAGLDLAIASGWLVLHEKAQGGRLNWLCVNTVQKGPAGDRASIACHSPPG